MLRCLISDKLPSHSQRSSIITAFAKTVRGFEIPGYPLYGYFAFASTILFLFLTFFPSPFLLPGPVGRPLPPPDSQPPLLLPTWPCQTRRRSLMSGAHQCGMQWAKGLDSNPGVPRILYLSLFLFFVPESRVDLLVFEQVSQMPSTVGQSRNSSAREPSQTMNSARLGSPRFLLIGVSPFFLLIIRRTSTFELEKQARQATMRSPKSLMACRK
ncbi:hypothetical protein B0T16DRAFT_419487 [Cercophora newfieldiana]|uniref:Uncharacterized protein n=1 Tax=Cercophora newfieldiana TaxID=92897 RepID=A0AA39XVW8_9PEZI|nr:hypothetical protein B0T16DRAFT_419487 [Cercophora newfieldiana]